MVHSCYHLQKKMRKKKKATSCSLPRLGHFSPASFHRRTSRPSLGHALHPLDWPLFRRPHSSANTSSFFPLQACPSIATLVFELLLMNTLVLHPGIFASISTYSDSEPFDEKLPTDQRQKQQIGSTLTRVNTYRKRN